MPLKKSTCQQQWVIKFLSLASLCGLPVMHRGLSILPFHLQGSECFPRAWGHKSRQQQVACGQRPKACTLQGMAEGTQMTQWDAEAESPDSSPHPCASALATWQPVILQLIRLAHCWPPEPCLFHISWLTDGDLNNIWLGGATRQIHKPSKTSFIIMG